jgi:type IV secretion system protein VirB8
MKMEKVATQPEKRPSRAPQSFEEAAIDFESSKIIGLALLCVIGILLALLNHTDPEPVVLKQNTLTGEITMLRSVKDAQDKYDEVTDKYWIGTYIRHRENYDWYTIGTESEIVKLMSAPDVGLQYMTQIQAPTAPLNMLKDKAKVVPKIASITFVGDLAQIRFSTERVNTSGENLDGSPVQMWIATLSYKFESGMMTDQQRLINPAGFKVISYRVDAEVVK